MTAKSHFDVLKLCVRLEAFESILPRRIFVSHRLIGRGEDELEIQECRSRFRIHRRPTWLIDDGNIRHLKRGRFAIGTEREALRRHRRNPIQALG